MLELERQMTCLVGVESSVGESWIGQKFRKDTVIQTNQKGPFIL